MKQMKEKFTLAISNAIKNKIIDGITISDLLDYEIVSYSPGTANKEKVELWTKANISATIKGYTTRDNGKFNINRYRIKLLHIDIQYDKSKEEFSINIHENKL
ncbi:MAG: hypothetical protein IKA38_09150 [Alistipes sp.]|nr:hypothetical protein [Alistipes sp.]